MSTKANIFPIPEKYSNIPPTNLKSKNPYVPCVSGAVSSDVPSLHDMVLKEYEWLEHLKNDFQKDEATDTFFKLSSSPTVLSEDMMTLI